MHSVPASSNESPVLYFRLPFPLPAALHCTALHCTALHCTALHCTALHCIALHCTALHCTARMTAYASVSTGIIRPRSPGSRDGGQCSAVHCSGLYILQRAVQWKWEMRLIRSSLFGYISDLSLCNLAYSGRHTVQCSAVHGANRARGWPEAP
jgi:hypothetical protein